MCQLCEKVKDLPQDQAINLVAEAMARGENRRHLSDLLDSILGTGLEDRDTETETAWETGYRRRKKEE